MSLIVLTRNGVSHPHSLALATLIAIALLGCGSDAIVNGSGGTGNGSNNTSDGSASLDATQGGQDGNVIEVTVVTGDGAVTPIPGSDGGTAGQSDSGGGQTVPGDAGSPPNPGPQSCAGKCGGSGTGPNWPCQCDNQCKKLNDCCGDYAQLCGQTPPVSVCGNGKCEPGENAQNCAKDCQQTPPNPGAIVACAEAKCSKLYNACAADKGCAQVLACIAACTDQVCTQKCLSQGGDPNMLSNLLVPVAQCAQQAGCFGGGVPPSGGGCGDGKCDAQAGENAQNCAKDCQAVQPSTPVETCLAANCTKSWPACIAGDGCLTALKCLENGGSVQTCAKGNQTLQLLGALYNCGQPKGCFSGGGTVSSSCKGKCGTTTTSGCQCNQFCQQLNNCCSDYAKECSATPPPAAKCGDGICDAANGETSQNCAQDCGAPPAKPCKVKGDCNDTQVCCAQNGAQVCVAIGLCQ